MEWLYKIPGCLSGAALPNDGTLFCRSTKITQLKQKLDLASSQQVCQSQAPPNEKRRNKQTTRRVHWSTNESVAQKNKLFGSSASSDSVHVTCDGDVTSSGETMAVIQFKRIESVLTVQTPFSIETNSPPPKARSKAGAPVLSERHK